MTAEQEFRLLFLVVVGFGMCPGSVLEANQPNDLNEKFAGLPNVIRNCIVKDGIVEKDLLHTIIKNEIYVVFGAVSPYCDMS
jgi:hypothetical protein